MNSVLPPAAAPVSPSRPAPSPGSGQARLFRAFLGARAVLGAALLTAQVSAGLLGESPSEVSMLLCVGYGLLTLVQLVWPGGEVEDLRWLRARPWWATVGLDIIVFTLLAAFGASATPVSAMYVLPVLMSAVLASRRAGLAAAAMATLGLLGAALWVGLMSANLGSTITQGGLAGIGYFVVALLGADLAGRLAGEQAAARGSLALARQQVALNQLVINEMREGVLVLDRSLIVRAANPAARLLLGEREPAPEAPFALNTLMAWAGLRTAAEAAWDGMAQGRDTGPPARDVVLGFAQAPARTLRVRVRAMPGRERADDLLLVMMEDRATLLARARQEKLAAMGRMSAGIAHEIRNPLAAISQANALLGEDLAELPAQQRLTTLVASNVRRLQRIVDEVMLLAAPADASPSVVDANALMAEVAADWLRTQPGAALQWSPPEQPVPVLFEPDHLRRVVVNLLDNAWRHAQSAPSPWVRLVLTGGEQPSCRVLNPSAPLAPEVERHLFEPFFSTRSRGSGLGLYICRELCERYGARIDYLADAQQGAVVFTVSLRPAP